MSQLHTVVVRAGGAHEFPLDMLRHDMLAPKTGEDVKHLAVIMTGEEAECFCPKRPETWPTITLVRYADNGWVPAIARWAAFGWEVMKHEVIAA